ncbi:hypothetical protein JAAARDRAFT_39501 [Jaapia argillacea MUCL 33604]|uniref:Cytochrome c oxidase subunit 4, mitochondrial n=1 Tax=Jaapia argillacea MUCL 33604 TaxID=933084 RepID=A0A067PH14_9AGAM|nr:hypothetical protein JAAARDRAFT_39501 [Jaapia argillacea MUCL 33604]
MFQAALRSARPMAISTAKRAAVKSNTGSLVLRAALSTTPARLSGDHHGPAAPSLYGPGAKSGTVPTDEEQATGLERLQLLGEMEGIEVFDTAPLDSSRIGTLADPIKVFSLDLDRAVGCTGSPADSHDVIWFLLNEQEKRRCPECGSVYELDFQGDREALAHAHH